MFLTHRRFYKIFVEKYRKEVKMMKAKSILTGFLTGALIAGVSTLLYAPASGKDLRKRINKNIEEIMSLITEMTEQIKEMKDEAITASNVSKESMKDFISDVKILIQNWKENIEPHKEEIGLKMKEIESALSELEAIMVTSSVNSLKKINE